MRPSPSYRRDLLHIDPSDVLLDAHIIEPLQLRTLNFLDQCWIQPFPHNLILVSHIYDSPLRPRPFAQVTSSIDPYVQSSCISAQTRPGSDGSSTIPKPRPCHWSVLLHGPQSPQRGADQCRHVRLHVHFPLLRSPGCRLLRRSPGSWGSSQALDILLYCPERGLSITLQRMTSWYFIFGRSFKCSWGPCSCTTPFKRMNVCKTTCTSDGPI